MMTSLCEQQSNVLSDVHVIMRPHIHDIATEIEIHQHDQGGSKQGGSLTRFPVKLPFPRNVVKRHHNESACRVETTSKDDDGAESEQIAKQSAKAASSRGSADDMDEDEDWDSIVTRATRAEDVDMITIEHAMGTSLPDVGLQVWGASLVLSNFILHEHRRFSGCVALELGGGTGITSIVMATAAKFVICTDIGQDILSVGQRNISNNRHIFVTTTDEQDSEEPIIVRELDWMSPTLETDELRPFHWKLEEIQQLNDVDVIFAADVIYSNVLTDAFFCKLQELMKLGEPKTCFIALEKRLNFTTAELDVTCKEYDHFRAWVTRLQAEHQITATQLRTDFPHHVECPQSKNMELWELKGSSAIP